MGPAAVPYTSVGWECHCVGKNMLSGGSRSGGLRDVTHFMKWEYCFKYSTSQVAHGLDGTFCLKGYLGLSIIKIISIMLNQILGQIIAAAGI